MESSEDDAGTATNASRRASAREKDVGLAEDVNATSSFQQKPSEERSSGETPAMSEDNFDGDSVPSPSSQDVNTSTEAILDMIDEIVDGPDAPKRLPLPSEFVEGLNEALATASYNLNIIQESAAKSHSANITPLQITLPVNSVPADCEIPLPETIDTPAECPAISEISTDVVNIKSVASLPASSSVLEVDQSVVSTKPEDSVVSNVETETSTSCPLPNIPSSSEEQTVKTVSDTSVSEPQDRTVKCVTSSDSRDNVTVESAESTSSDSSVSESKALFVEPQVRSPLRRRLVRPVPSDRRPDSTVSSTVDSQNINDNIATAEQSSSENITKDVTSSSDAVPIIHGNVKPEEISNVSEINFCIAETSVSPKKIKLIRQKSTGIINRETPLNIINVLTENEQCQSTSRDNYSVNLSHSTSESSSTVSILQSQDTNENVLLGTNSVLEKQLETPSSDKECHNEHPQPTSAVQLSHNKDDLHQGSNCEQSKPAETSLASVTPSSQCNSEQEMQSLPISQSTKQATDIKINDLEQGRNCNTHDNEDYIPLHLPPNSKILQSKSRDLKLRSELNPEYNEPESITTDHGVKSNEIESSSGEQKSCSNELHSKDNELELKGDRLESQSNELDSMPSQQEVKNEPQSLSSDTEPKSSMVKLKNIVPKVNTVEESKCIESDSKSHKLESHDPDSLSSVCDTKSNMPNSESSELVQKSCDLESTSSDLLSRKDLNSESFEKTIQLQLDSSRLDSMNTEIQAQKSDIALSSVQQSSSSTELSISKNEAQSSQSCDLSSSEMDSQNKLLALSNEVQPEDSIVKTESSNIDSKECIDAGKTELKSNSCELEPNSSTIESQSNLLKSQSRQPKSTDAEPKNSEPKSSVNVSVNCQPDCTDEQGDTLGDLKKVAPFKLNLPKSSISESKLESQHTSFNKNNILHEESDSTKQVPKLTIKLKQPEEVKSLVPKLTIKPIKVPVEQSEDKIDNVLQVPCVKKINIKPIVKSQLEVDKDIKISQQVPCITKLNIKPILKPPEKINDIHRKSSSSEISESECSENDETTSTSDQASASDHGSSDVVPKVTIKLGKPGTESEGKFYTEKNVPKLTIKGIKQEEKVIISQSEDTHSEKVPKLTIKTVTKTEGQPLSPKLTIKPLKPPDSPKKEGEVPKVKIITESFSSSIDGRESPHVPKITIKPVTRADGEARTPKKSTSIGDTSEHIHAISKLNIKPILKPAESEESSESFEDKVPVVSKINIKPVVKPKDNDLDSSIVEVPKITKLNIKPIKNPEDNSSEEKDCDESNAVIDENSIPVVTKLNIKPIVKPEEENEKDSENLSSETGNSSDDNGDHIPVVTKLNIKPILKPDELQETSKSVSSNEQSIPVVTKLNIKPLIKPGESSPSSPKKEHKMDIHSTSIPVVTKLNIKPVVRPEDTEVAKIKEDNEDKVAKNPPLVMKINMKSVTENVNHESTHNENECNDVSEDLKSGKVEKYSEKHENQSHESEAVKESLESRITIHPTVEKSLIQNCIPETIQKHEENLRTSVIKKPSLNTPIVEVKLEKLNLPVIAAALKGDSAQAGSKLQDSHSTKEGKISIPNETHISQEQKNINFKSVEITELNVKQPLDSKKTSSTQNCTLLKKLLENTQGPLEKFEATQFMNFTLQTERSEPTIAPCKNIVNSDNVVESGKSSLDKTSVNSEEKVHKSSMPSKVNDLNKIDSAKFHSIQELTDKVIDNITKPLEITISDKLTNQSSGQDSPRIILKINKTDHGPSAKIITEDVKRPDTPKDYVENTQDIVNDKQSPKRHVANSRRKQETDTSLNLSTGKRLRSSRIVENTDKSQVKRHIGKRPSTAEVSTPQNKESELTILQSKRLKLGQLLSGNKSLSIPPALSPQTSPTKTVLESNTVVKPVNHSLLNNENCSKNGNSKLHNILSNLQAKQIQSLSMNNTNCSEKAHTVASDIEFNPSKSSTDTVEVAPVKNSHLELQQMIINENSDFRDLSAPEESSQDPLEVVTVKPIEKIVEIPKPVELTPQPKKRGRPRKVPLSEPPKPVVVTLPVPALEERPQRSLRLMRDRPTILSKPRGRGRGRGGRRAEIPPPVEEPVIITNIEPSSEETPVRTPERTPTSDIDPTSSRIKLPRMTEALDKMPSMCTTPLTSRRRSSSGTFSTEDTSDLKLTMDSPLPKDEFPNTPEPGSSGRRRGRGSRGGRGRTPRGRGRGRGGGRGAMYMKETLGIYGRVCGPATTTVQLFEEETCMMDDNATPAKPSHLLDEDSQSSVKSSTNESNKMKKSKFADLFDSNKVWTAADVKEYTWQSEKDDGQQKFQVMMIQEQVAMFLGVKSFKRRYPELKRRTIYGEERDYILSKGLVSEALCDLGITAVDASEVLDIMLSDYPHKYEEYRSHQRQRQLTGTPEESMEESKPEEKAVKVEIKAEKPVEQKPELPKVDPEKTRLDMAAAAIASASEWNARANAARKGACADLQSLSVLRPRAPPVAPARPHLRPPAGFYPHALLPGQYQHSYRVYTPDQLRYFPLNTVLAAPPAPPSVTDESSESEPEWGSRCSSSDDSDVPAHHSAKRKKLTKVKRVSNLEAAASVVKEEPRDEVVDLCRVCKLRLEANRRYTHERFLVCSNCDAKLHPSCLELNADTIRKCREYAWQCAECKTCCSCRQPADDDKMLFCDLCDRGFHIYCVGLDTVPSGRWHCVSCAVCKSCGARSPEGLPAAPGTAPAAGPNVTADWHHQTRRGPGGHKVYSHSLCTPCARAYRIGRYCPLCERSFIGPKGTMQLVICKLCDRQLHQECVRRTVSALNVLDYTCAECRRGGITSRAAAVRLAPRTIATLFMAKRRFNKYAHRQYMQSRLREMAAADAPDDNSVDMPDDEHDAGDPLDVRPELDASDPLDLPPEHDAPDAPE